MRNLYLGLALVATAGFLTSASAPIKASGSPDAPIRLEVFSDYQCPYCKKMYLEVFRPLIDDYVSKGKIYLVHREFPLPIHAHAYEAACLACAAHRIGKYEQVCDAMFRQQEEWAVSGRVGDAACSVLTPEEAKQLRTIAKDPSVAAEIQDDVKLGQGAGVKGTPTAILTYHSRSYGVPTGVTYPVLRRFVDQLLSSN
jgi:protein-disulfide isomerase